MIADDLLASFSLDNAPVRGRIARIGPRALDPILRRHAYPRPVAMLLGEALSLAALVGSLLKVEGRLVVQAQGDGPAPLLVAEWRPGGSLRGYARVAEGAGEALARANRMAPRALIGEGQLVMMLEQSDDIAAYQGSVPLEGETLAACAESYFRVSEQTETHIQLAIGEVLGGAQPLWRGGGVLMQKIAADQARGDPTEDWSRASILFATLTDEEVIDPDLLADRLLYRLFHEEGVRMAEASVLRDECTCTAERLTGVLKQFPREELTDLVEPDGLLHARCQFCAREYKIEPKAVGA